MFEGCTEQELAEMVRRALNDPERRQELLTYLDEQGLLPENKK